MVPEAGNCGYTWLLYWCRSKDVLNYGIGKSIDDGLKYVASMNANITPSYDLLEAVSAFAEKRKPKFTGT
jgi:enoyl-CoA hydratase